VSAPGERILVVEDEVKMRKYLRTVLDGHGFTVIETGTLADGLHAATHDAPDLILLDLGLPDGDGIDLVRRLREWTAVPIIVLSARGREDDKVEALETGADDYLTKPFGANELYARIRVALRHARGVGGASDTVFEVGPIRIDYARREVTVNGEVQHLTPIEYRLLTTLARHVGQVLTHHQLAQEIWGERAVEPVHTLRVHMASLRRKVEEDPGRPMWLVTEVGVGYRLREAPRSR
jgi:two-component system KDP operon response regulator KdpE